MDDSDLCMKCPNCGLDPWRERMLRLVTDSKFHDVSFIVGNTNRMKIGCNRSLLSIHCPVFEAMFCNGMLESSSGSVELPDINPVVFASMLQWMSTNTLNISSIVDLSNLIKLADKYQIYGLMEKCCEFLKLNTITIHVITDEMLTNYHGVDLGLYNLSAVSITIRILSYSSIDDVILAISKQLHWDYKLIQLWRISNRKNATIRPNRYLSPNNENIIINKEEEEKDNDESGDININDKSGGNIQNINQLFNLNNMKCNICYKQSINNKNKKKKIDWTQYSNKNGNPTKAIYARLNKAENVIHNNNSNNKNYDNKILLFLKYYDVYNECLSLISSILVNKNGNISEILNKIREIAHWSDEREILLFEEEDYNSNKINPIKINQSIGDSSLVDGDIIVFQEKSNIFKSLKLNDVTTFFNNYQRNNNNNMRSMSSSRIRRVSSNNNNNNNNNINNNLNPIPIDDLDVMDDPYTL